jgi:5'-3' exonuclease
MGIPYYFYTLTQKYQNILVNVLPYNPDIYCIDFNGIIHAVAQNVIKYNQTNIDEKIIKEVWKKTVAYIDFMKPKKIIICADGVAPLAKMAQQRKRRYLSVYRNKIDNITVKWDTNAITPGTDFMNKLNIYMKKQIKYIPMNVEIIYSGSDETGEGEHKIFDKLLMENVNDKIIINGLDADLIILALLSHKRNIFLMRETADPEQINVTYYLCINTLRGAIIQELISKWDIKLDSSNIYSQESNDLIESYCVACSIFGNDFIPHLPTLNTKIDGMEKLIKITKSAIENNGLLVINGSINHSCLTDIFKNLSDTEDIDIFDQCEKYIKKTVTKTTSNSDLYAIKNKDQVAYNIYNNKNKWRHEYYKGLFNTNITLSSYTIFSSCENYIKGIYWTYAYYKKYDIDYNWYYPYNYPPTIKDIANHAIANNPPKIIKNGDYVDSSVQLLTVLPRESIELLSKKNRVYMEDIKAGFYHMYPSKYKIQTFLKTHLWECSPILPTITIIKLPK